MYIFHTTSFVTQEEVCELLASVTLVLDGCWTLIGGSMITQIVLLLWEKCVTGIPARLLLARMGLYSSKPAKLNTINASGNYCTLHSVCTVTLLIGLSKPLYEHITKDEASISVNYHSTS